MVGIKHHLETKVILTGQRKRLSNCGYVPLHSCSNAARLCGFHLAERRGKHVGASLAKGEDYLREDSETPKPTPAPSTSTWG